MVKNISFLFIVLILLFFFITCTQNGVECSLTGKWNIVDLDFDDISVDSDEVEGILEITYNDTFELDMEFKLKDGSKIKIDDYGTLKACSYNKYIQFFSDDEDGNTLSGDKDSLNCNYILNSNNLTIYNDDFNMELLKTYQ